MHILEHWSLYGLYMGTAFAVLLAFVLVRSLLRSTRRLREMEPDGANFSEEWLCQYRIILVLLLVLSCLVAITFLKTITLHSIIPYPG